MGNLNKRGAGARLCGTPFSSSPQVSPSPASSTSWPCPSALAGEIVDRRIPHRRGVDDFRGGSELSTRSKPTSREKPWLLRRESGSAHELAEEKLAEEIGDACHIRRRRGNVDVAAGVLTDAL